MTTPLCPIFANGILGRIGGGGLDWILAHSGEAACVGSRCAYWRRIDVVVDTPPSGRRPLRRSVPAGDAVHPVEGWERSWEDTGTGVCSQAPHAVPWVDPAGEAANAAEETP